MDQLTHLLSAIDQGDPHAAERLLPLVYDQLRKLAAQKLAHEQPGQTLQPTALVHEAYLRLVGAAPSPAAEAPEGGAQPALGNARWNSRGHFFAAAAEAMRRILVENARRKRSLKRGGDLQRIDLEQAALVAREPQEQWLALDEALEKLAKEDPRKAELVKLRYFAGLSVQEAADFLGISRATADRDWAYAKVFLYCEITGAVANG
jgi:RNA polymerase sigma factor (sigma-70 family)